MMFLRFVFFLSLVLPDVIKYLIAEKLKITGYKSRTKTMFQRFTFVPRIKLPYDPLGYYFPSILENIPLRCYKLESKIILQFLINNYFILK